MELNLLLEDAEKFQKAFDRLEDEDTDYLVYFGAVDDDKNVGPPNNQDWDNARVFVKFLKIFYNVTLAFSGSLYVTSNGAFHQLALVQSEVKKWSCDLDSLLGLMATDMKRKYDKYWGKVENINPLLFIANILDPRYKLAYIDWSFADIYGPTLGKDMTARVKSQLTRLYEWYSKAYEKVGGSSEDTQSSQGLEAINK